MSSHIFSLKTFPLGSSNRRAVPLVWMKYPPPRFSRPRITAWAQPGSSQIAVSKEIRIHLGIGGNQLVLTNHNVSIRCLSFQKLHGIKVTDHSSYIWECASDLGCLLGASGESSDLEGWVGRTVPPTKPVAPRLHAWMGLMGLKKYVICVLMLR